MPRAKISVQDKIRLVRCHLNLEDYLLLADQLNINRKTARSIVARAMAQEDPENIVEGRAGGATSRKVDEEMKEAARDILSGNPAISIRYLNLQSRIRLPLKPSISDQHLGRVCKDMFFTLKKLEVCPADRNREDVKNQRLSYATWFMETALTYGRRIYIDETGYDVHTQRTRGRALMGHRAVRVVNGQRGQNVTLLMAVSPQNGVEHYQFHVGGTSKSVFTSFFNELVSRVGCENQAIFILDNATCHRSLPPVSETHIVKYLPPYSPFLTPVENSFSAWKWKVKHDLAECQAEFSDANVARERGMNLCQWRRHLLVSVGESAIPVITSEKCTNWEQHCLSFFPHCFAKSDIIS